MSGCGTNAPKQPTPSPTVKPVACELVPCRLSARPALVTNEDALAAIDAAERDLLACAVQVLDCIQKQEASARATESEAGL
ncbi:Rz1-like lysis system protein LysC [Pseudomonas aeruginosa]|uniref:Rz1-like lysis system protein LysC n=1 Tax=Pseudomonas aeruginosa TaxID=287 RepID=UPI003D9C833D